MRACDRCQSKVADADGRETEGLKDSEGHSLFICHGCEKQANQWRERQGWSRGAERVGHPVERPAVVTQGLSLQDLPDRTQWVGVIGSRRASSSELAMARQLGATIARQGRVVVSGLALGIDGAAHDGALSVPEGLTVAILSTAPSSVEPLYPPAHRPLADRISARGALVHPFSSPAASQEQRIHRLLERDLLLAQWVSAIVVVSDREPIDGGSRWAAGAGLRRGIPVFRLDSHGRYHRSPAVLPSVVTWDVECANLLG